MFAAIADGNTDITGFLTGEDTMNTAKAVRHARHRGRGHRDRTASSCTARGWTASRSPRRARSRELRHRHAAPGGPARGTGFLFRPLRGPVPEKEAHGQDRGAAPADGRRDRRPFRRKACPARDPGRQAANQGHRVRQPDRQRPGEVGAASGRPLRGRRDVGQRAVQVPGPYRADAPVLRR